MSWRGLGKFALPALLPAVLAFNATSTSFYARQDIVGSSGGSAISGYSTSTTFRMVGSEGETGLGTSTSGTSFNSCSGFLCSLFKPIYPQYTLTHYHWRNDDGSETTATSGTGGTQDTATSSVPKSATKRLRVEVSNEGGTEESYSAQQFRLEYGLRSTTCAAISSWTDVGAVGGDWDMSNSTNLTNGNDTTNIATGVGGVSDSNKYFIGTGGVLDTSSQSGSISVPSHSFVELEYSIQALSGATSAGTYCFRVTNAGSTANYIYSAYPTATIAGSVSLTLSVSTDSFGSVTPGTAKFATTTVVVNTNNTTGWNTSLSGDQKDTTHNNFELIGASTTQITDQTEWVPGSATTSAGNAVRISSFVNSQNVLAFRTMTASGTAAFRAGSWWGSADTYADNASTLWAGIPSSTVARQIGNSSVSSGGSDALNTVLYYLNPAPAQKTGQYLAPLTVTVTANP
jgi:hypothetical protein